MSKYIINATVQANGFKDSTGTSYPTKTYVDQQDNIIKAVAEGKCKSLVLDVFTFDETASEFDITNLTKYDTDENFTSVQDFYDYVGKGAYSLLCYNTALKEKTDMVEITIGAKIGQFLVINSYVASDRLYYGKVLNGIDLGEFFKSYKVGDNIFIKQTQIQDRWVGEKSGSYIYLFALETAKVDLTEYYTKTQTDNLVTETVENYHDSSKQDKLVFADEDEFPYGQYNPAATKDFVDDYVHSHCITKQVPTASGVHLYGVKMNTGSGYTWNVYPTAFNTPLGDSIVMRTNNGRIKTALPTEDNDAASKFYVDQNLSVFATKTYVDQAVAGKINTITLTQADFDELTEYADNTNYQII